jgi:hypothetical protein
MVSPRFRCAHFAAIVGARRSLNPGYEIRVVRAMNHSLARRRLLG